MDIINSVTVVGGVYEEYCERPYWHEIYGSAGRAVEALVSLNCRTELHSYMSQTTYDTLNRRYVFFETAPIIKPTMVDEHIKFAYLHGLSEPHVSPIVTQQPIKVVAENILLFGMIEGEAIVDANKVVYDPQSTISPKPFKDNGSNAKSVALVLNYQEALAMVGGESNHSIDNIASKFLIGNVKALIIKDGPLGAHAFQKDDDGFIEQCHIPSYMTASVHKIGSGDNFSAHFAYWWMIEGLDIKESATKASLATAYYCLTKGFATTDLFLNNTDLIQQFKSIAFNHTINNKIVYLAGPFFTLAEVWLIQESYMQLKNMGIKVFSPYHDIGLGSADEVVKADLKALHKSDVVFAICDGLDAGTVFEVGYARALGKKVIVYCENEQPESLKMFEGSDCVIVSDYVTAIYQTIWNSVTL